jgi:hypothetical protein
LAVNKASVGAFGNPRREDYDHYHHRHLLQNLYSMHYNDVQKSKTCLGMVLGAGHGLNLYFVRERAQRWRVNQESSRRLLTTFVPHETSDGKCAIVVWLRKMNHTHKSSSWINGRSKQCVEMLLMPEILTALWFEAELGEFFATTGKFHKSTGPHSFRAGFRILEHHGLYLDYVFPWWKAACETPEKYFPNTLKSVKTMASEKGKDRMMLQINCGLLAGKKEVAKMSHLLFSAPLALMLIVHPTHGPAFTRALLRGLAGEGIVNLAGCNLSANDELDALCVKMVQPKIVDHVHYWKQHGFNHVEVVSDYKRVATTSVVHTDIAGFEKEHAAAFECLDAAFGLMTSSSLLAEQIHGSLRGNMTKEQSARMKNGKQAHLTNNRHDHLQHQKNLSRKRFRDRHGGQESKSKV